MDSVTPTSTTWNLTPLYKSDNDPKILKDREKLEKEIQKFIKKWQKRTDYLKNPKVLKQALDEYEHLNRYFGVSGNEGYYFHLRTSQDQNDPKLKAKMNQIIEIANNLKNNIQFFELSIAKIDPKLQPKFLNDKYLNPYRHFLEKLFKESKYLLSDAEEKILNLKHSTSYSNWVKLTSSFLSKEQAEILDDKGKKSQKSFEEILTLTYHKNKKIRDTAAKAFNQILEKNSDIAENEINSVLTHKKINDNLRGFTRPDQSRHLSDDISTPVVDALIDSVSSKFDIPKRFYKLKAKLFKVDKLEYHERNVEYGDIEKNYSYKDSINLIFKVFNQLDPQFAQIFSDFIKNGQIDVYPKLGKHGGAFCTHDLLIHPTYVLLNHTDKLRDVLTIAHEMGHAINNELMRSKQNSLNFGTTMCTAEVASTFMEDFVLQELLKEADEQTKLSLMLSRLQDDINTIFRQIACYKFEQELHQAFAKTGYLSKQDIGKIFQKHMSSYMGPSVIQSHGSQNWWIYWSHIRTFFYVYSYSSGLLISKSLQNSVKNNPSYINNVKEFLAAGLSDSPQSIFSKLGINITNKTFWQKGLDEIELLLTQTEKLAKKLNRI